MPGSSGHHSGQPKTIVQVAPSSVVDKMASSVATCQASWVASRAARDCRPLTGVLPPLIEPAGAVELAAGGHADQSAPLPALRQTAAVTSSPTA
jgi:hypothetical protein